MTATGRAMAPRLRTPVPDTQSGPTRAPLPDDLIREQRTRLAILYAVGAMLWAIGLVLDEWLLPAGNPWPHAPFVHIAGASLALALLAHSHWGRSSDQRKMDIGLAFMLPNALAIALLNSWEPQPVTMRPLSWIAIVILVFGLIAPSTPRRLFLVGIVAAAMDPLGVWVAHLRGLPVPSPFGTFLMFLPNFVCAGVAVLPSHLLQRLGRRIRDARELGNYQLVGLLGRGGMGEVWIAEHRLLARSAAIKLIRPELLGSGTLADTTLRRRFEREVEATAALSSPHTIRLFDFGVSDDGMFYYVMELLTGRDLESLVREFGPVPADRAQYLLRQACHSLADAHARGFIHRDIKPANIYVCRMGLDYDFVKVLDFGLVKDRNRDAGQTLMTAADGTTGTPAYMAPEIILGEVDVDRRADVYALGCVAYFLLTGQLVFEAETPMKMVLQHVQSQPVPPSKRTELAIPRELDELVLACLEKNPENRPQDAQELFLAACGCNSCNTWNNDRARGWWEAHLPDLTRPLDPAQTA